LFRVLPDDRDVLGGDDVIAGLPIVIGFHVEAFG
jgi:hypothetical protein